MTDTRQHENDNKQQNNQHTRMQHGGCGDGDQCAHKHSHHDKGIEDRENRSKCQLDFTLGPEACDGVYCGRDGGKKVGINQA